MFGREHSGTITFRNADQQALWELELTGQISDGHWENARPDNHWQVWCHAKTAVGPDVGRDFYARKDNYNLCSGELLEVVGQRMLVYVRLARAYGIEAARELENMFDLDGKFRGMPKWWNEKIGTPEDRYKERREALEKFDHAEVKAIAEDETKFTWRMMVRELVDMKKIIRTQKTVLGLSERSAS